MRVAIVHHWFVTRGGGEQVAEALATMFPNADLFTLVMDPRYSSPELEGREIRTSVLQRLPFAPRIHRHLMPLYPFAVEQLDLRQYDLVFTSDSGPMKGVITNPRATHICYCHTPMRYLWDGYHAYLETMPAAARIPFALSAHYLRNWDYLAAQRVSQFIANSHYVAGRIRHFYGRESKVIYPPVNTSKGRISPFHQDFYLAAGRLVGYKKTEILIEACNRLKRRLVVIGTGPEYARLRAMAGPTVEFRGFVQDNELWEAYATCRALLFAAEEDCGIVPLEAQACGRPVIAYGSGGSTETVRGGWSARQAGIATGIYFDRQTPESVEEAIRTFEMEEASFQPGVIQAHAAMFSKAVFRSNIQNFLAETVPSMQEWARLKPAS